MVPLLINLGLSFVCSIVVVTGSYGTCPVSCPPGTRCARAGVTCTLENCTDVYSCEFVHNTIYLERRNNPTTCPARNAGWVGPCVEQCRRDADCRNGRKCCFNGCGHTCRRASRQASRSKPGSCPWHARVSTLCRVECVSDHECPGRKKCCVTSCGAVCSQPCFHWLTNTQHRSNSNWGMPRRCQRSSA